ncbi:MAG TPA: nickel pincer cofactor biosynthesis protein LarC [Candidatus Eisenbacteria bacterium]|nr:nickel pincer cofactor biosynthesis protein LarC [Candidatus Eisenbacteria bacterium]
MSGSPQMKIAFFDCPSGASGDMILGALVDAGAPFEALTRELAGLGVAGYRLERREVIKAGFRATKVDVALGHHEAGHRGLREILDILEGGRLAPAVREMASRVFRRLAEAEARVHGTTPERVHFHDVGAVDAIVDVTGACIGLHLLGVDAVHVGALPVGGGFVEGPHGRMPVPGPATAELLKGFPTLDTGIRRELVTPTGAAILTTLAAGAGVMPAMRVTAVGYGAGTMDLETPNVLRLFLGEAPSAPVTAPTETIVQVETTVDDMSPQLYEPLLERLLEAGALDVWLTPVIMKRSRPGVVLTALCEPARVADLSRLLFEESSTIGVRWTAYQRARLEREMVRLDTAHGPVTFKVSRLEGRVVTVTPEFEEVRRIARDRGLPVREVLEQARVEGRRLLATT